jgi:hypothetical protein
MHLHLRATKTTAWLAICAVLPLLAACGGGGGPAGYAPFGNVDGAPNSNFSSTSPAAGTSGAGTNTGASAGTTTNSPTGRAYQVIYRVTGTTPTASVLYTKPAGGTESFDPVSLPWMKTVSGVQNDFLYLTASIPPAGGNLRVEIWVEGRLVKFAEAGGAFQIATTTEVCC